MALTLNQHLAWEHHSRALLALMMMMLLACPYQSPGPAKAKKPPRPTHPLSASQAETFQFPADGRWHESPWHILSNQVIEMRPIADSAGLSEQAIRFKVGGVPQMLRTGERLRITIPGPLGFRVDPRFTAELTAPVTVEVKRLQ